MESTRNNESDIILHDLSPMLLIYKDGRIERQGESPPLPPSRDPQTGVESKDIHVFPDRGVYVRIFKPDLNTGSLGQCQRLPVLVFFHGGGFCIESTFSPLYHNYLNSLASKARVLVVSVEYRLAPEHPLPAAYDDCWDALDWAMYHSIEGSSGSSTTNKEPWLLENADFSRVFLAGDSAGGNIAHHMALRVGNNGLAGGAIRHINGTILFHPFFWSKDRIGDEVVKLSSHPNPDLADKAWAVSCPERSDPDDPWVNPAFEPTLSRLGCDKVLIFVAEKDFLRDRGVYYKELLEKSGWKGKAEVVESKGEDHVFHLFNPSCANATDVMTMVAEFLNRASLQN